MRATTAAPSYFTPLIDGPMMYADGAFMANNPTSIALTEVRVWVSISVLVAERYMRRRRDVYFLDARCAVCAQATTAAAVIEAVLPFRRHPAASGSGDIHAAQWIAFFATRGERDESAARSLAHAYFGA